MTDLFLSHNLYPSTIFFPLFNTPALPTAERNEKCWLQHDMYLGTCRAAAALHCLEARSGQSGAGAPIDPWASTVNHSARGGCRGHSASSIERVAFCNLRFAPNAHTSSSPLCLPPPPHRSTTLSSIIFHKVLVILFSPAFSKPTSIQEFMRKGAEQKKGAAYICTHNCPTLFRGGVSAGPTDLFDVGNVGVFFRRQAKSLTHINVRPVVPFSPYPPSLNQCFFSGCRTAFIRDTGTPQPPPWKLSK